MCGRYGQMSLIYLYNLPQSFHTLKQVCHFNEIFIVVVFLKMSSASCDENFFKMEKYFYFNQVHIVDTPWLTCHLWGWARGGFWEDIMLTHWGWDRMAAIFQTTFSDAFSWMKIFKFRLGLLKFVPKSPINNIPALVQIMAWRRPGDKPLYEPMMVNLSTHICVTRPQWVNGLCWLHLCHWYSMMMSSNGDIFHVTGLLCGEFIGPRWIPLTKASDAELWYFLWSVAE